MPTRSWKKELNKTFREIFKIPPGDTTKHSHMAEKIYRN